MFFALYKRFPEDETAHDVAERTADWESVVECGQTRFPSLSLAAFHLLQNEEFRAGDNSLSSAADSASSAHFSHVLVSLPLLQGPRTGLVRRDTPSGRLTNRCSSLKCTSLSSASASVAVCS